MFFERPCFRRLEGDGKRVSQAGQGCPVSLDMLWPSRERERFDVCETCGWGEWPQSASEQGRTVSSSVWWGFDFRLRDGVRGSGGASEGGGETGEGHTGDGAGCFDKGVSPRMHTLHAGAVCVVCPRDGLAVMRGLVWGDDGGAVGGGVVVRVGGVGIGGGRAGG